MINILNEKRTNEEKTVRRSRKRRGKGDGVIGGF